MGRQSLFHQASVAINQSFEEGRDKHSDKKNDGTQSNIYSYSQLHNLKDFSKQFTTYMKQEFGVKFIKDIKVDMVQSFLNSKTSNCTQQTINVYNSNIGKLQNIFNTQYSRTCNLNWQDRLTPISEIGLKRDNRGVDAVISRGDYNKILEYGLRIDSKAQSFQAISLQNFLGIRVVELVEIRAGQIKIDGDKVLIALKNTKGGKPLERHLQPETKEMILKLIEGKNPKDKIFTIKDQSVNRWLNRTQDKLGLERHSTHDIRRLISQEKYDSLRAQGLSRKEAMDKTSEWLNHGKDRDSLLEKSYIKP